MAVIASIAAGVTVAGGLIAGHQEKQAAKGFGNDAAGKAAEIAHLERNRQSIPNPYASFENVSDMATDLSSQMSNPYLNLGVATQAADMQAEQADISLANTLDAIRATGSGAGGATALAQAALQSKKEVSASIESQEAMNQKLAAQGEEALQNKLTNEQIRLQGINMSEAQRMQTAEAQGIDYQFQIADDRDITKLNRLSDQEQQNRNRQAAAKSNQMASYGGIATGLTGIATGALSGGVG
tara:strand:- start:94 stop:816 length:723 start_codon:yes stop_codon:yes gene_type:complete